MTTTPDSAQGELPLLFPGSDRARPPIDRLSVAARLILSILVGGSLTWLVWTHLGHHLSAHTNVVGSTTFTDFDIDRYHDAFYLSAIVFPLLAVAVYAGLARAGFPRRSARSREQWWPLPVRTAPFAEPAGVSRGMLAVSQLGRLLVPALALGFEVSIVRSGGRREWLHSGFLAGLAYVILAVAVATGLGRGLRIPTRSLLPHVNLFASLAVIPGLYSVSERTSVLIQSTNTVVHYRWLPLPLVIVAVAALAGACGWALWRNDSFATGRRLEARMVTYLVAPVLMFTIVGQIPHVEGRFLAFDDAHYLVGANLTFQHGLFPFRNLYLLHGVLADDLYGQFGIWLFGDNRWGSLAGQTLFVAPLTVVLVYLFGAYFARRNRLSTVAVALTLLLGLIPASLLTNRFVFLPPLIIIFDRLLAKGGWAWSGLFMFVLVAECILTPETGLMAVGLLGTLIAYDVAHRSEWTPIRPTSLRTGLCLIWGLLFLGAWAVYLLANGAVRTFLDYYITAAPGHKYEGAHPPSWKVGTLLHIDVYLFLPVVLLVATIVLAAAKVLRRSAWRTDEWVLVATASFVVLYFTKALDRLDAGHVYEVFTVATPLVVLWGLQVLRWGDGLLRGSTRWPRRARRAGRVRAARMLRIGFPMTAVGALVLAVYSPEPVWKVFKAPASFSVAVPVPPPADLPRLGYTVPGTVDTAQIEAVRRILDTYAGPTAPVYDLSGEAGVLYYLLDRVPASRFYVTQIVQTPYAQRLVVQDLSRSRPPVIIFNNSSFGLPVYDGITTMERDYNVSQYVLDHYRPLASVEGQLVMIRDDLAASAPPLPALGVPVRTTDLYNSMAACDWGDVPNFFATPHGITVGRRLQMPLKPLAAGSYVTVTGWELDRSLHLPASELVATSGGRTIAQISPVVSRADIAAKYGSSARYAGFALTFTVSKAQPYTVYAVSRNGPAVPVYHHGADTVGLTSVDTGDGVSHRVVQATATDLVGHVDAVKVQPYRSELARVPPGVNLASYSWVYMNAPHGLGTEHVEISDVPIVATNHSIEYTSLSRFHHDFYLQVGSCLQWHGYQGGAVYLFVTGTSPILPPSMSLVRAG